MERTQEEINAARSHSGERLKLLVGMYVPHGIGQAIARFEASDNWQAVFELYRKALADFEEEGLIYEDSIARFRIRKAAAERILEDAADAAERRARRFPEKGSEVVA